MTASDFLSWASAPPSWITTEGDDLDGVVIGSRIRLARSFLGSAFSHHALPAVRKKTLEQSLEAVKKSALVDKHSFFALGKLPPIEKQFLRERHLLPAQRAISDEDQGLIVSSGERVSVLMNEEDHLQIACFGPGLALGTLWNTTSELDDDLASRLPFAYSQQFGYLTASPHVIGTGLRAACLLHLPALVLTGKIKAVIADLAHDGLTARGFYGEGDVALGDLFQISNGQTLGVSESQIIKGIERTVKQLSSMEKEAEESLNASFDRSRVETLVAEALGTLKSSSVLLFADAMKCLSVLRLGLKMRVDGKIPLKKVSDLFFLCQPAHLRIRFSSGEVSDGDEARRASFLSSQLNIF